MNQCLRCNQLCSDTSTFCSVCQSSLLQSPQQQYTFHQSVSPISSPAFQATRVVDHGDDVSRAASSLPSPIMLPQRQSRIPHHIRVAFLVLTILAVGALL